MTELISGGSTMTEGQESKGVPPVFTDKRVLAWIEEHVTELRQSVSGQRILYRSLGISFVVGVAAHVGRYALLSLLPSGSFGLLAHLLHALGWSLWIGVVVVVFVQVIPEAKRRQIRRALDAYEALRRDKAKPVAIVREQSWKDHMSGQQSANNAKTTPKSRSKRRISQRNTWTFSFIESS
jgi:hypothetical protein